MLKLWFWSLYISSSNSRQMPSINEASVHPTCFITLCVNNSPPEKCAEEFVHFSFQMFQVWATNLRRIMLWDYSVTIPQIGVTNSKCFAATKVHRRTAVWKSVLWGNQIYPWITLLARKELNSWQFVTLAKIWAAASGVQRVSHDLKHG